jgi:hypothetical protein
MSVVVYERRRGSAAKGARNDWVLYTEGRAMPHTTYLQCVRV